MIRVRLCDGSVETLDEKADPMPRLREISDDYKEGWLPILASMSENWVLPTIDGGWIPKKSIVLLWEGESEPLAESVPVGRAR